MNERRELVAGFTRRNSHRAVGVEHFGKDLIDVRYSCLSVCICWVDRKGAP